MKMLILTFAALLPIPSMAQNVSSVTKEVRIGINSVYVPDALIADAEAYVVISGVFQNGCYSWSRAEVSHKDPFTHTVSMFANVSQGMCIMALIPFQKEIRLGKLERGKHHIRFENGDGTSLERAIKIE